MVQLNVRNNLKAARDWLKRRYKASRASVLWSMANLFELQIVLMNYH